MYLEGWLSAFWCKKSQHASELGLSLVEQLGPLMEMDAHVAQNLQEVQVDEAWAHLVDHWRAIVSYIAYQNC